MRGLGLLVGVVGVVVAGCAAGESEPASGEGALGTRAVACNGEQQLAAFNAMINAPLVPPRMIGGLDLAGGDTWAGLTISAAEQKLCQGTPTAATDDAARGTMAWGLAPNHQVTVEFDKASGKIDNWTLNAGYKGKLEFQSRPTALGSTAPNPYGEHRYSLGVGTQILRDGQPWEILWQVSCQPTHDTGCWQKQLTELFDAAMFTFAPELKSTQENCVAEQLCLGTRTPTKMGLFGIRPLGFYLVIDDYTSQPAASTPSYFYGFYAKTMPFSGADLFLQLDGDGPRATAKGLGDQGRDCAFGLGTAYSAFLDGCVKVQRDADMNAFLEGKLLGGATRTISTTNAGPTGTWILDVAGTNPNFASERFDERAPLPDARMTELSLDLRSSGKVLNEFADDGVTQTLAATGAIYREYAQLVQSWLHEHEGTPPSMRFPLGAPECLPAIGSAPAPGCTGMEQFLSPAEPTTTSDPNLQRMSIGGKYGAVFGIRTTLKPGTPRGIFCVDPGTFDRCSSEGDAGTEGRAGSLFETTRAQIVAVLGSGEPSLLPEEAREAKLYVRLWAKALVKYLSAAGQRPVDLSSFPTPADEDIHVAAAGDIVTVRYKSRLEIRIALATGEVQQVTFR
jgi:hypothetical protein